MIKQLNYYIDGNIDYGLYYGETISKALIKNNENKLVWEKLHNE